MEQKLKLQLEQELKTKLEQEMKTKIEQEVQSKLQLEIQAYQSSNMELQTSQQNILLEKQTETQILQDKCLVLSQEILELRDAYNIQKLELEQKNKEIQMQSDEAQETAKKLEKQKFLHNSFLEELEQSRHQISTMVDEIKALNQQIHLKDDKILQLSSNDQSELFAKYSKIYEINGQQADQIYDLKSENKQQAQEISRLQQLIAQKEINFKNTLVEIKIAHDKENENKNNNDDLKLMLQESQDDNIRVRQQLTIHQDRVLYLEHQLVIKNQQINELRFISSHDQMQKPPRSNSRSKPIFNDQDIQIYDVQEGFEQQQTPRNNLYVQSKQNSAQKVKNFQENQNYQQQNQNKLEQDAVKHDNYFNIDKSPLSHLEHVKTPEYLYNRYQNENFQRSSNKKEMQDQLIYPFKDTEQYANHQKQTIKGVLIEYDGQYFENDLKDDNLNRFKLSCLKQKERVFETNFLSADFKSEFTIYQGKQYLKLSLIFTNKSQTYAITNFQCQYLGTSQISLWTKPMNLPEVIEPQEFVYQELMIEFQEIPYHLLTSECELQINHNSFSKFNISIPMTINKFMSFQIIDVITFKNQWKQKTIFKSDFINLNQQLANGSYDFKKHFQFLIDTNSSKEYDYISGKSNFKIAGAFTISNIPGVYLLRITNTPQKTAMFQIGCSDQEENIASFILNTLQFIFKQ